jgi:hypothetical protein
MGLFKGERNQMIFRLAGYAALGLLGLYAAEGAGFVPTRQYFPSLPRFEQSSNTLGNWQHGAAWGKNWLSCVVDGGALNACSGGAAYTTGQTPFAMFKTSDNSIQPASGSFTNRISAKRQAENAL